MPSPLDIHFVMVKWRCRHLLTLPFRHGTSLSKIPITLWPAQGTQSTGWRAGPKSERGIEIKLMLSRASSIRDKETAFYQIITVDALQNVDHSDMTLEWMPSLALKRVASRDQDLTIKMSVTTSIRSWQGSPYQIDDSNRMARVTFYQISFLSFMSTLFWKHV